MDFEVACLPSLCQNCAQRHECAFRVRNRRNVIDISVKLERTEYQQMEALCLFFCDFSVPFDNNLAESDLRHAKVKQKVSGCFRTDEGAKLFAKFNSYLSTAKKRGCTSLRALELLFQGTPMLALGGATE